MITGGLEPGTVTNAGLLFIHCNVETYKKTKVLIGEMLYRDIQPDGHTISVLRHDILRLGKCN